MKTTTALVCLLLIFGAGFTARADGGLTWIGSDKDAAAQARAIGKPRLLYLHADYCIWCRVMEDTTFQDSRVRLLADQYVLCKLNGEREGKSALKKYGVEMYPFDAILDESGDAVAKEAGFLDADKYSRFLAQGLSANDLARMNADRTAHPDDACIPALLATVHAERDETEDAAHALAALSGSAAPTLITAANHAVGLVYSVHGDDAHAVPCLQTAASAASDPREIIALRFLLAASYERLHKRAEALAEMEVIRRFRSATAEEKKRAKRQEDRLLATAE